MQANPLDYPRLVQDALRGVVRRSLSYVQTHGLPGEHHFYLAFATEAPGVSLSEDLRRRYPDQITIVLQHDYRDLDVDDEYFAVTLRFGG
ncbi:MAG: ClpXP protease specificity-enhancing factor SspB, partial [Acidobacteriota bacterium]